MIWFQTVYKLHNLVCFSFYAIIGNVNLWIS